MYLLATLEREENINIININVPRNIIIIIPAGCSIVRLTPKSQDISAYTAGCPK